MNKAFSVPPPALGRHLLVDFWGAGQLVDPAPLKPVLEQAAQAAGAVVLEVKLHDFGERAGFTGVALLAESHISVHTWPEHGYAAIDVFMCGDCDPMASIDVLRRYFVPVREDLRDIKRGTLTTAKT